MARTGLSPVEEAGVLHANLCALRPLVAVAPPVAGLLSASGEWALGVLGRTAGVHLDYARHCGADVVTYSTGPAVVFGSPQFLAGYALGTVAQRARLQRTARRLAAPQWRRYGPLLCVVVTNHRLWCQVAGQWVNFDYDTITGFDLTHTTLTLSFAAASPLRISGPWALWIGAAVAHLRYADPTPPRASRPWPPSKYRDQACNNCYICGCDGVGCAVGGVGGASAGGALSAPGGGVA